MKVLLYVFLGGGLGSVLRYGVQMMMHHRIEPYSFPWATMTVNIVGSMLIGVFYALSTRLDMNEETKLFLTAGLCGGFTTFSTFSNDGVILLRSGCYGMFATYVTVSVLAGVAAAFAGGKLISNLSSISN